MAIADLLAKLVELKSQLVTNLNSMGVTANESEKLNTLVPKVLKCKTDVIWSQDTVSTEVTSVNIPNGVTLIEPSAFDGCTNLSSITIPNSVTSIGSDAFMACKSLTSITIPDSVTSISDGAFYDCSSLSSVTIGNGVMSIGDLAFAFCTSLAHIYYKGTKEQWNAITKGMNWNDSMGTDVSGGTVITYNYTG